MEEHLFTILVYRLPFGDAGYHAECIQYPQIASDGATVQAVREAMVSEIVGGRPACAQQRSGSLPGCSLYGVMRPIA
ncbi:MAG TPA: hypothetical protein VKQ36_12825 [Ktedonobacterales bacterium]|nr:hypothetical protein [Ktedonobacterales bacterium]